MLPWLAALTVTAIGGYFAVTVPDAAYWRRWHRRRGWWPYRAAFVAVPSAAAAATLFFVPAADPDGVRGLLHGAVVGAASLRLRPGPRGAAQDDVPADVRSLLARISAGLARRLDDGAASRTSRYLDALKADPTGWAALLAEADAVVAHIEARRSAPRTGRTTRTELGRMAEAVTVPADVLREIPDALGTGMVRPEERARAAIGVAASLELAMRELRWSKPPAKGNGS